MAKMRDPGKAAGSELLPRSLRYLLVLPFIFVGVACGGGGSDQPEVIPTAIPTQVQTPVVAVPTPTAEPPVAAPVQHTVAAGETLSIIADKYGVTVEAIVEANDIANPDLIAVGQVLTIPTPAATAP